MLTKYLTYYKFGVQLLSLTGLFLICNFLVLGICYFASPHIAGIGFEELNNYTNYTNVAYLKTLKITQIIYTIGGFLLPALLYAYLAYPSATAYLGIAKPKKNLHILWAMVAIISSAFFITILAEANTKIPFGKDIVDMENKASELTKAILNIHGIAQLLFTLFYIALLPAIAEEFLFRGCLQNILITKYKPQNFWVAIVITGIIFGIMHGQMLSLFPRIALGILLGFAYYYSGSIWVSIAAHFVNNGLQVLLSYLYTNKIISTDIDNSPSPGIALGLLSAFISVGFILMIYKHKVKYNVHSMLYESQNNDENDIANF